ncbi:MAG: hypothetical protein WBA41_19125 [Rivularia sp. (in: cyanobacteria)]
MRKTLDYIDRSCKNCTTLVRSRSPHTKLDITFNKEKLTPTPADIKLR